MQQNTYYNVEAANRKWISHFVPYLAIYLNNARFTPILWDKTVFATSFALLVLKSLIQTLIKCSLARRSCNCGHVTAAEGNKVKSGEQTRKKNTINFSYL